MTSTSQSEEGIGRNFVFGRSVRKGASGMAEGDRERLGRRVENFGRALGRLESACAQGSYSELERAGLVQMFEFTHELAWKALKEVLGQEGFAVRTPREAIRTGFEAGLLDGVDTEIFLEALGQRNLMSHTYDEAAAARAEELIRGRYAGVLRRLFDAIGRREAS